MAVQLRARPLVVVGGIRPVMAAAIHVLPTSELRFPIVQLNRNEGSHYTWVSPISE
jgi:hypothetical protein